MGDDGGRRDDERSDLERRLIAEGEEIGDEGYPYTAVTMHEAAEVLAVLRRACEAILPRGDAVIVEALDSLKGAG